MRLLAPRALTVAEVRARLGRRGYSPEATLAERRLYGKSRVAAELARRGIAPDAIGDALERAFAGLDEDVMARKAFGRAGSVPADRRGRERAVRALLRRGFSRGAVARALAGAGFENETVEDSVESEDGRHDDEFQADS